MKKDPQATAADLHHSKEAIGHAHKLLCLQREARTKKRDLDGGGQNVVIVFIKCFSVIALEHQTVSKQSHNLHSQLGGGDMAQLRTLF